MKNLTLVLVLLMSISFPASSGIFDSKVYVPTVPVIKYTPFITGQNNQKFELFCAGRNLVLNKPGHRGAMINLGRYDSRSRCEIARKETMNK